MDTGDDAFGALEYDLNEPQRQHGGSGDGGEEDDSHAVLRTLVLNRPLMQPPHRHEESSPLDWHLKIGEDLLLKRRLQEESSRAMDAITARILLAKKRRLTESSCTANSTKSKHPNTEEGGNEATAVVSSKKRFLLALPPMTGVAWYGVCSRDNSKRAYLEARLPSTRRSRDDEDRRVDPKLAAFFAKLRYGEPLDRDDDIPVLAPKIPSSRSKTSSVSSSDKEPPQRLTDPVEASALWLDKYCPERFLDLLSENPGLLDPQPGLGMPVIGAWRPDFPIKEVNRITLLWLKLWDAYVFKRKFNAKGMTPAERRLLEVEERGSDGGMIMPRQKLLLLHGPSGSGKSSLAMVAARQAGYTPFVVNINELTSVSELSSRIEDISSTATSIQSMFTQGPASTTTASAKSAPPPPHQPQRKPNCIIIEGIDFAPVEMCRYLAQWVKRSERKHAKRPIIASTNNFYAVNLRPLRECCLALKLNPCSTPRLMKRLQEICAHEAGTRGRVNQARLMELIEASRGDIRLCLNTLQFMYASCSGKSTPTAAGGFAGLGRGGRDDQSIFDAMSTVITLDPHSDVRGGVRKLPERLQRVVQVVQQRDDLDRFYQALFHNLYGMVRISNSQLKRASQLFVDADLLHVAVYSAQQFHLLKYLPSVAAQLHLLMAIHLAKRPSYDMKFMVSFDKLREATELLKSVRVGAMKFSRCFHSTRELVVSTLPALYYIAQPPIQTMNSQLFGAKDLNIIQRVVEVMLAYGLGYAMKYEAAVGGAGYGFEPAFDSFVCYPSSAYAVQRPHVSNIAKKHIGHQLELEAIKRSSADGEAQSGGVVVEEDEVVMEWESTPAKPKRPLFSTTPLAMKARRGGIAECCVFRYNQGSSKAIKRNVRIGELFPWAISIAQ